VRRDLEQRYRRTLRMLPGYYRNQWEEDMVAAFLDGFLTGDPDEDEIIMEFARPSWSERASVAALATRLYLGGQGTPRRYFAWGQAVRRAVLIVMLGQAILALGSLVYLTWLHHRLGWFPAPPTPQLPHVSAAPVGSPPPQSPAPTSQVPLPGDMWSTVWYAVGYAWVVAYIELALGYYRTAQLIAVLAIGPNLVYLVQLHVVYHQPVQLGPWAGWILADLAPALAMAAFHRDAPPVARRPWLLALPAGFVLVAVPILAAQVSHHADWIPGWPGLGCILVAVACLVHVLRARSRRSDDSGGWSLALILLAVVAGVTRIGWLTDQLHDSLLMTEGKAELLGLVIAVALVAKDAARAQAAMSSPPPDLRPG